VAEELPNQVGAELLDAARESFTQGLRLTAVIGVVIVTSLAILAAVLLRRVSAGSEPESADREPSELTGESRGRGN
jgi:MFS transporter, DHA2 family, multidrug resistance protein